MKAEDVFNGANCGIVGINEELEVFGGYDNPITMANAKSACFEVRMSREEKVILADRMIVLWKRYKELAE